MRITFLLLVIGGCSGAPVSPIDQAFDASPAPDASDGRAEGHDAASIDASDDDASACTPFTVTYDCHNNPDTLSVPEPSQYCYAFGPDLNTANLSQMPTPTACQCVETFNCTCVEAHLTNAPCDQPLCHEGVSGGLPVLLIQCP